MHSRRRGPLIKLLGLTVVFAAALSIGVGPASAYSREYNAVSGARWTTGSYFCISDGDVNNHPAVGCFRPNGDDIEPGDLKSDGLRVGVQWKTGYGRFGLCYDAHGKDATFRPEDIRGVAGGHHLCNKNFKEGTSISIRVGTCNGSKLNCSKLKNWRNWSTWITRKTNA